jgi:hypothetical protein
MIDDERTPAESLFAGIDQINHLRAKKIEIDFWSFAIKTALFAGPPA